MCKEGCLTLVQLGAAAFVDTSAEIVRSKWVLRDGRALLAALSAGTARMAAVIAAQEPSALTAIADDIDGQAERSAAAKIPQFPLQRCWRGSARPQTDYFVSSA